MNDDPIFMVFTTFKTLKFDFTSVALAHVLVLCYIYTTDFIGLIDFESESKK